MLHAGPDDRFCPCLAVASGLNSKGALEELLKAKPLQHQQRHQQDQALGLGPGEPVTMRPMLLYAVAAAVAALAASASASCTGWSPGREATRAQYSAISGSLRPRGPSALAGTTGSAPLLGGGVVPARCWRAPIFWPVSHCTPRGSQRYHAWSYCRLHHRGSYRSLPLECDQNAQGRRGSSPGVL